jgi:uncharacterized protein (DUF2345 family)
MMKRVLIVIFSLAFLISGCRKDNLGVESDGDTVTAEAHDDPSDYVWLTADVIPVTLNGTSITMDSGGAIINGSVITITSAGTYSFSGDLNDGQLIVDTQDDDIVRLILDGVNLNCASNPPLLVSSSVKTMIVLNDGTINTITDGDNYNSGEEYNAAIYSLCDLTFYGNGELIVNGNYNDGITSKDGLIIASGSIKVNAKDDGITGKDYLIVKEGELSITSGGDGLKSDNEENTSLGYITLQDGTYSISAGSDAIQAETSVIISNGEFMLSSGGGSNYSVGSDGSAKGIKAGVNIIIEDGNITIDAADDGLNSNKYLTINSGYIEVSSADDGIKADENVTIVGGVINVLKSEEGIESSNVTIDGGDVSVVASDDGINTTYGVDGEQNDGSLLTISSGYIFVTTSQGDAIDSNGEINVTGGTIVVHGSTSEGGFDVNGDALISGGFVVISGSNNHMTEGFSSKSDQYSILFRTNSNLGASSIVSLMDEDGNELFTFAPSKNYSSIVFSSEELSTNKVYKLYTSGTYSDGNVLNGLYEDGSYSPGNLRSTFSITSKYSEVNF